MTALDAPDGDGIGTGRTLGAAHTVGPDPLDPGGWRPKPRRRWTRSVLYGTGVKSSSSMARYLSIREMLGLSSGRRSKVSHDLMDRAEWVDVDPDDLPATLSTPAEPFGVAGLDAEERVDLARFVALLDPPGPLTDRHRHILARRASGDTLYEVARDMRLSTERVRQLELEAYRRVRRAAGLA